MKKNRKKAKEALVDLSSLVLGSRGDDALPQTAGTFSETNVK